MVDKLWLQQQVLQRLADALHQALPQWRQWVPSSYQPALGIQLGALVWLVSSHGARAQGVSR